MLALETTKEGKAKKNVRRGGGGGPRKGDYYWDNGGGREQRAKFKRPAWQGHARETREDWKTGDQENLVQPDGPQGKRGRMVRKKWRGRFHRKGERRKGLATTPPLYFGTDGRLCE